MVEYLNTCLPIFIYILLCVLIILLIVICFKVINTMNRVQEIVDDVDEKVKSLNGAFGIIDKVTDKISVFTDVLSDSVVLFIKNLFKKGKKKISERKEEEDE